MIIATDIFDKDKVLSLKDDYEGLCSYVWTLVPEKFKHLDVIYHNTRYYINMCILQDTGISLDVKTQISKLLTRSIRVVGYMDKYITCRDLDSRVDMNKVNKYHEGDKR